LSWKTDIKNESNEAINRMDDAQDRFIEEHKALIRLENWSNGVASLSRRPHSFSSPGTCGQQRLELLGVQQRRSNLLSVPKQPTLPLLRAWL
jgi:hypothetical protein